MPSEGSAKRLGHTKFEVVQHAVAGFLRSEQLLPDIQLVERMTTVLNEHDGVPNAESDHINRPLPEVLSLESINPESQPIDDQQSINGSQLPVRPQSPPLHERPLALEATSREEERQMAAGGEHASNEALPVFFKRMARWIVLHIVGVLSLIVVPGLVLGVVTRHVQWGIALSGAIATVASFVASLYYNHKK